MLNFLTNKQAAEKIEGLEARIVELEADAAAAQSQIEALKTSESDLSEKVANLTTANGELLNAVQALTGERDSLATERDTLTASLKEAEEKVADFDGKVEAAAIAKFQALGGEPAPAAKADFQTEDKEVTREKFNSMSPADRTAFAKAGGKIKG